MYVCMLCILWCKRKGHCGVFGLMEPLKQKLDPKLIIRFYSNFYCVQYLMGYLGAGGRVNGLATADAGPYL